MISAVLVACQADVASSISSHAMRENARVVKRGAMVVIDTISGVVLFRLWDLKIGEVRFKV
jgi:hypothetical protein